MKREPTKYKGKIDSSSNLFLRDPHIPILRRWVSKRFKEDVKVEKYFNDREDIDQCQFCYK